MNNFEKYNKLHNEIMKRLEDGEITVEQAKEVSDLAFDKYISETVIINKPVDQETKDRLVREINIQLSEELMDIRREYDKKIKETDDPDEKAKLEKEKQEKIAAKTEEANKKIANIIKSK